MSQKFIAFTNEMFRLETSTRSMEGACPFSSSIQWDSPSLLLVLQSVSQSLLTLMLWQSRSSCLSLECTLMFKLSIFIYYKYINDQLWRQEISHVLQKAEKHTEGNMNDLFKNTNSFTNEISLTLLWIKRVTYHW